MYLLADEIGETTANTADLAQSVHDLAVSADVGVQHTEQTLSKRKKEKNTQRVAQKNSQTVAAV